ncbi:MAG: IS1595 family transposase [Neisseriaceae bacterium]|nr:IS1595 family transposase [Neisseriaceae bacterium]
MERKNRYQKCGKISDRKFRFILKCFSLDFTASDTARLTGISIRSINNIFLKIRYRLLKENKSEEKFSGTVEMDESYFGAKRIRGKRGRGAKGKTIVFGILNRGNKVYTQIIPNIKKLIIINIITEKVEYDAIVNTDGWIVYYYLKEIGYNRHYVVNHANNEFACGGQHINGIESFWSYAKNRLVKFNGVAKHLFFLHLNETEFRYNNRQNNLYKILLKMLRNSPL